MKILEKRIVWIGCIFIAICSASCDTKPESKVENNIENMQATNESNSKFETLLPRLFEWYIGRPANTLLTTAYDDRGNAYIQNKENYLNALRESGYFTTSFVNQLGNDFAKCEKTYGKEELDEHLPCLETDPVTIKSGFDQFDGIEIISSNEQGNSATVVLKLSGQKELSGGQTTDRSAALTITLSNENNVWLADQIAGNEE